MMKRLPLKVLLGTSNEVGGAYKNNSNDDDDRVDNDGIQFMALKRQKNEIVKHLRMSVNSSTENNGGRDSKQIIQWVLLLFKYILYWIFRVVKILSL